MDEELHKEYLVKHLDHWIRLERQSGNIVPDYWHECNTSDILAEYLVRLGYRRVIVGDLTNTSKRGIIN